MLGYLVSSSFAEAQTPDAAPGEFLIKFSNQVNSASANTISFNLGLNIEQHNELSDSMLAKGQLDEKYAKDLLASGAVEYIEPNYIYTTNNASSENGAQAFPNDQRFTELWGMHNPATDVDIDGPDAWSISTGDESIVVGVVDTGIDFNHPDLVDNIWINQGEIPGNGLDDDGNGVIDDIHGYNASANNGNPLDDNGHGTHCAGTVGARGDNTQGVIGVNWNVKLMALKFLDAAGAGSTQNAIEALEYAVRMKRSGVNLRVLNNSWGGPGFSQALAETVEAVEAAGILFVAAAGNSGNDIDLAPSYPASYRNEAVISVAAIDQAGNLANFSNYGSESVDLAAPGVGVLSTHLNGRYRVLSGTSMAAPHVSGVAALLLSTEPLLSVSALKARLNTTIKPLATMNGLTRYAGMVNAGRALTNTLAPDLPVCLLYTSPSPRDATLSRMPSSA